MNWSRLNRKVHSWGAILTSVPLLVVIVTGLLLQVRKEVPWVQPPAQKGITQIPEVSFDAVLKAAALAPEAGIHSWDDVDRLDVRPSSGMVKVRAKSGWEVQVDTANAKVLQVAYRRSDFIEAMHDGSFFHTKAKLWVFFPAGILLLILWLTGMYLWAGPRLSRYFNRRHRAQQTAP